MRALPSDPIERLNLTFSMSAVAAGWALHSPAFAMSLALGAAIETLNFRGLRAGAVRMFSGDLAVGHLWLLGFGVRFVAMAAAIGIALHAGVHPVGLVLGLSAIVPATVVGAWWLRPPVLPAGPALPPEDPSWDRYSVWLAGERPVSEEDES